MINQDALDDIGRMFRAAMDDIEKAQEEMWSKLTEEQRLAAFCCVVRRIYEGELVEQRSYRGVLYDTFGFGPEAYTQAQCAGYLAIHNSFMKKEDRIDMLTAFALKNGIEDPTKAAMDFFSVDLDKYI